MLRPCDLVFPLFGTYSKGKLVMKKKAMRTKIIVMIFISDAKQLKEFSWPTVGK